MISGESMNWHEDAGEAISLKILAFDQASQKTGVAWFEDSTLLGYEVLDYSRVKDADLRVRLMMESMFNLIGEHKPDALVFEGVALQRSAGAVIMLAQIQGGLMGYCYSHNISGMIYKPSVWRKMLGFKQGRNIKRAQLKAQAQKFVKDHYDIEVTEDEADAICIGLAFACEYKETTVNMEYNGEKNSEKQKDLEGE